MVSVAQHDDKDVARLFGRPEAPIAGLVAASLIVGVAIATSGPLSKAVNGVGGILWIASAILLGMRLRSAKNAAPVAALACAVSLALVLLVKPADLLWAGIGFAAGGAILSLAAHQRRLEWAAFMAAIWLPVHLLVAITRVIERSLRNLPAHVRTDPPPTAALVPFAMIVCALIGAHIVSVIQAQRDEL